MTVQLDAVRSAALALPESEERADGFYVAGAAFVRVADNGISVLAGNGWMVLGGDDDTIGERVARSWELAAPARLLEAGGR